jgi:catalase
VSGELATRVAQGFGLLEIPRIAPPVNHHVPADADPERFASRAGPKPVERSPALSMADTVKDTVRTRRVAILAADGVDAESLRNVREALLAEGALPVLVAPRLGPLADSNGALHWVEQSLLTGASVLFDAVFVPGGPGATALADERDAVDWVAEAYRHCKPIAASEEGVEILRLANADLETEGVLAAAEGASEELAAEFVAATARHRYWERPGRNRLQPRTGDRETRGYGPALPSVERVESRI